MATATDAENQTFSLNFIREHPADVTLEGGAHYPQDDSCLRLTDTKIDRDGSVTPIELNSGRAIYTKRTWPFSKETTFVTTITFTVKPKGYYTVPADGLVFFMAPVGHVFPKNTYDGNFGVFDLEGKAPKVLAVEFDAFLNPWDPNYTAALHLGIDIHDRVSQATAMIPNSASYIGEEVTLTVTYTRGTIRAKVSTDSDPNGFELPYQYDLSTVLPNEVQVGLAASTGLHVAFHDVFAWEFTSPIIEKDA